jgi:cytochrome d ubiquinol oxidase subunit I
MLTADGFNNSPEVLPIGISIMVVLALAVGGTIYMLKKLFTGKEVSADVSSARLIMATNAGGSSSLNIKRK